MSWGSWVVITVVLTWTIVMMIHVGKLGRAYQDEDWLRFKVLNRMTMWMVGIWQIALGVSFGIFNIDQDGGSWSPALMLVGCGLGIIALDRLARRLEIGVHER